MLSFLAHHLPSRRPAPPPPPPPPSTLTLPPTDSHPPATSVLELFQSQSCSSCPPTNLNALKLAATDPSVLLLTYHVTYWDHLGWRDTFGDSRWDERQRRYARRLGRGQRVFTPQVVVNGCADGVGNSWGSLGKVVVRGRLGVEGRVGVDVVGGRIVVRGGECGEGVVVVVCYETELVEVEIEAGENRGKTLPHRNVVRDVRRVGVWRGGVQAFEMPEVMGHGLGVAVLVQAGEGGPILGVARVN